MSKKSAQTPTPEFETVDDARAVYVAAGLPPTTIDAILAAENTRIAQTETAVEAAHEAGTTPAVSTDTTADTGTDVAADAPVA